MAAPSAHRPSTYQTAPAQTTRPRAATPEGGIALSAVLPVKDAEGWIGPRVRSLVGWLDACASGAWEMLVVDDGSADGTWTEAASLARDRREILLLRNAFRPGPGSTARHGVLWSRGRQILLLYGESPLSRASLEAMRAALQAGNEVVVGSRGVLGTRRPRPILMRRELPASLIRGLWRLLIRRGNGSRTAEACHLYSRDAALEIYARLRMPGDAFPIEALYLARRYRYPMAEIGLEPNGPDRPVRTESHDPATGVGDLIRIRLHRLRGDYG